MLARHGPILSRHLYPWSLKNLYLFVTKWPSILSRNFKQKPTHVSADRMVFVLFGVKIPYVSFSLRPRLFFLLNSEAYYVFPAWSSFEVHREIIFIKLKKNYPAHDYIALTRWQTSIQFVSGLRTGASTQVFYLSYVFLWTYDFRMHDFKNSYFSTPFLSAIYTTDHTI